MMIFAIALPLLLAAFYSWTSRLNQFFFFGRTVPQDFAASAEGRAIVAALVVLLVHVDPR